MNTSYCLWINKKEKKAYFHYIQRYRCMEFENGDLLMEYVLDLVNAGYLIG